jgi:flagellar hook-associated protein 2
MGSITTGVGLISGIDTAALIDSLITLESRGKVRLEQRVSILQAQRTALLDINARLLNLKNISKSFRLDSIFRTSSAFSSNEDVLIATASTNAQPGTFSFLVKQLVASSQKITRGFATADSTPLGLNALSFELGNGKITNDAELAALNGGEGVRRGKITITDRAGAQATVDLSSATSIDEVIEAINNSAGVQVSASISGDRLQITDTSGGGGTLTIANATGYFTATDLGIATSDGGAGDAGAAGDGVILGGVINHLGGGTSLSELNDGTGVLVRNNVTDLVITARDGTAFNIDFGRQNAPITTSTLLSELNNGSGITIGDDENNDVKFVARDGTEYEVSLNGVTTVQGLFDRVTTATGGHIALSIDAEGDRLVVTDTIGGADNLKILGAGDNGTQTALDLGILNEAGAAADTYTGVAIPNTIADPPVTTLQGVIDRINNASDAGDVVNGGRIVASIAADGVSLQITDTTGGGGNLIVAGTTANPHAAAQLGIATDPAGVAASTVSGTRLLSSLNSVLLASLNGGSGLSGATSISITDRNGTSFSLSNLDTFDSLSDVVAAINDAAAVAGADITLAQNTAGNGLRVSDSSGGTSNLIIDGDGAAALGISTGPAGVASTTKEGANLQLKYVSEATRLAELNYGRGIGTGEIRITDADGNQMEVNIGTDAVTLFDVINEINGLASAQGVNVLARVNDNGDGLAIENSAGTGTIRVESISGTTAKDLNILATADGGTAIDGSYERTIAIDPTDTLNKLITKITAANIPVGASVLNTGSTANPYRLVLSSKITGAQGELIIDTGGVDIGLTTVSEGKDAKVFFGSSDPANAVLISSGSNTIKNAVPGLTVDLKSVSNTAVDVTVARDTVAITEKVTEFVTALNDVVGRLKQYDSYNTDTEARGVLLGHPTVARLRTALYATLQGEAQGVSTQYTRLSQIGIRITTGGTLEFDEEKFSDALAADPQAVENLFAAFEGASGSDTEEIAPGVTIPTETSGAFTALGFGDLFDQLMNTFTNSIDGVVTLAEKNFQSQIDRTRSRIEDYDKRLEAKRARLEAQFLAMERSLALLQGQGNALASMAGSLSLAQSRIGGG